MSFLWVTIFQSNGKSNWDNDKKMTNEKNVCLSNVEKMNATEGEKNSKKTFIVTNEETRSHPFSDIRVVVARIFCKWKCAHLQKFILIGKWQNVCVCCV